MSWWLVCGARKLEDSLCLGIEFQKGGAPVEAASYLREKGGVGLYLHRCKVRERQATLLLAHSLQLTLRDEVIFHLQSPTVDTLKKGVLKALIHLAWS